MTLTTGELSRFSQCGHKYLLASQGVPLPPSTRQAVSRAARKAIQLDLCGGTIQAERSADQSTPVPPQSRSGALEPVVAEEMAQVALTPAEASRGLKTTSDRVLYSVTRLFNLWRAVVKPRITHTHLNRGFELGIGGATITGHIEIQEAGGIRATKVRTRRPEAGEAERDIGLILQCIAAGAQTVTVDYLIEAATLSVDRQVFALSDVQVAMARERVACAVQAIKAQTFLPADLSDWRCVACPLRAVCRYV
jgi:hypothetical protein